MCNGCTSQAFSLSDSGSAEQRHTAKAFHAIAICCNIASVVYYAMVALALIITLASIFGTINSNDNCYHTCNYDNGDYRFAIESQVVDID